MMYEDDYILKAILLVIKALAEIVLKKSEKRYEEALQSIEKLSLESLKLSITAIRATSIDDIYELFKVNGEIDINKVVLAAILLKEEGQIYEAIKKYDDADERYYKSLKLLLDAYVDLGGIDNTNENLIQYFSEIPTLVEKYGQSNLPDKTKNQLLKFYEESGRYSKAEDLLYEIILEHDIDNNMLEIGFEFYDRMSRKSDDELIKGNLPRKELFEGVIELEKLKKGVISQQKTEV